MERKIWCLKIEMPGEELGRLELVNVAQHPLSLSLTFTLSVGVENLKRLQEKLLFKTVSLTIARVTVVLLAIFHGFICMKNNGILLYVMELSELGSVNKIICFAALYLLLLMFPSFVIVFVLSEHDY